MSYLTNFIPYITSKEAHYAITDRLVNLPTYDIYAGQQATILRDKYGYLDENMLLTSVVRNSFLNEETFKHIKDSVKERSKIKWWII